jgi:tetratricopeptide (TPR) repeat protein
MRLAIVATPSLLSDMRAPPGALDGDVIRSRLPLPDTAFEVFDIDPRVDVAEQLDVLFDARRPAPGDEVLFYVSASVALSIDNEFFLCLDPESPQTGDALADVAAVFRDRVPGPVLFVLECRHAPSSDDPFRSAAIVTSAKEAVEPARTGIELLIAARPATDGLEEYASPFTRALISALDDAEPEAGLSAHKLYERVYEHLIGAVPCFAHARGRMPFSLIPPPKSEKIFAAAIVQPGTEPPTLAGEVLARGERFEDVTLESEAAEAALGALGKTAPPRVGGAEPGAPGETPRNFDLVMDEAASSEGESQPAMTLRSRLVPSSVDPQPFAGPDAPAEPVDEPDASAAEAAAALYASATLPEERSFTRAESHLPRVIIAERAPASAADTSPPTTPSPQSPEDIAAPADRPLGGYVRISSAGSSRPPAREAPKPPPEDARPAPEEAKPAPQGQPAPEDVEPAIEQPTPAAAKHREAGDAFMAVKEHEAALGEFRKALGHLGPADTSERGEIYVCIANAKWQQDKRREAIASFEKALSLLPEHRPSLEALVDLNVGERDWRAVQGAEDRLLESLSEETERFDRLVQFAERWEGIASDPARARATFERAREMRPDDLGVLGKLRRLYEQANEIDRAIATRRRMAELAPSPRERARAYAELAEYVQELGQDEVALELYELAAASDPSQFEPLDAIERILSERQEWGSIDALYRSMLARLDKLPRGEGKSRAASEICRRLGLLFRDHLDDPLAALTYFERAADERPGDLGAHLVAAELARETGNLERALPHLREAARLDPQRLQTYHDLFEVAQKLRQPDTAFTASAVAAHLGAPETRERFVFEEHKPSGVPRFSSAMPPEGWDLLRDEGRNSYTEAVLAAIAHAAIPARLGQLAADGRLPTLDPELRQDPRMSTISIVRSFAWGSHFLGVAQPAIYVREDAQVSLVAIPADEPTVLAGALALRGRGLADLAFLVGRHLTYHLGHHRLLLFYPSLEELSACFVTAAAIALPAEPIPPKLRDVVSTYKPLFESHLDADAREVLEYAVTAFAASGARPDLPRWAAAVERCATRAGFLLAGDLEVAATILRSEPRGALDAETKIADLLGFSVSEGHHTLREALGVSIQD